MIKYIVRHGALRFLGEFAPVDEQTRWKRGDRIVVRTARGLELGDLLCEASERSRAFMQEPTEGQILRRATENDRNLERKLVDLQKKEYDLCRKLIEERRLQMDLVDVEHLFGNERIVFYFLVRPPEKRVDFRDLVRDLARECQTRIEMRQIGVRDEAKLLADYGDCGKPVCCNTHLTAMPPVSMRMAKLQKSTLDPNKISGRCGRLKCCLRYEFNVYEENQNELPQPGVRVVTKQGPGKVLAQEILARKLVVEFEDRRRVIVPAEDILTVLGRSPGPRPPREPDRELDRVE